MLATKDNTIIYSEFFLRQFKCQEAKIILLSCMCSFLIIAKYYKKLSSFYRNAQIFSFFEKHL